MENTVHVKPKSSWKKIALDRSFSSGIDFAGPAYIEVLEDYDISSFRDKSRRTKYSLTKNKKKKTERRKKNYKVQSDNGVGKANNDKKDTSNLVAKKDTFSTKKAQKRKRSEDNKDSSAKKKIKKSKLSTVEDKNVETISACDEETEKELITEGETKSEKDRKRFSKEKPTDMESWEGLHVPNVVLWALKDQGFTSPTQIQARTLPSAIRDRMDVVGAAETGSGKTLAFGIPIIHYILQAKHKASDMEGKVKGKAIEHTEHTKVEESEGDSENNLEGKSQKSESDVEELEDSLEDLVGESGFQGSDDILESGASDDENDDNESEKSDEEDDDNITADDDNSGDDEQTIEDRTEVDIEDEEVHSDDDQEVSDVESSDENEFRELPENELGCVRVVKDVDFSWIEKEKQDERKNIKTRPFALVLEPTRELAIQVKNHLTAIAKHTDIKIATVVGGMSVQKQRRVLKHCPDVLVATPGRLWDLLQEGVPYLSEIERTGHLVIDEADRMVEKGHFEELASLLRRMNSNPKIAAKRHTYVFSATLTTVHEGPQRTDKRKKNKIVKTTETQKLELLMQSIGLKAKPKVVDLTRKVGTVETLTEARIHCSNEEKDVYLYYFLKQYPGRTLVFCNSKDCIRRLVSIFNYLKCCPLPLHADMHQRQRLKNLDKFTANPRGLLIASDVAARGLDIPNVQHVIHFQVPNIVENYIHRSGRTARASKEGLSIVFIGPNDMKNYKKIINTLNRDEDLPLFPVETEYLSEVKQRVDLVREIETEEYRFQKRKRQNDWFKKMADESGIDIEDEGILADTGDDKKQAEHRRSMKFLKAELEMLLKQPIVPLVTGGKYPTKSGKLAIPVNKSETGGALAHLKTDKKKQEKIMKNLKKKHMAEKPLKKKKDKWKKKKQNRMMAKMN